MPKNVDLKIEYLNVDDLKLILAYTQTFQKHYRFYLATADNGLVLIGR